MAKNIVLAGAAGTLGKKIAAGLIERGAGADVLFGSRSLEALADLMAEGYETATVDFDDSAGMAKAFAGATTLMLISTNGPDAVRIVQHKTAIDAAKGAGIKRIVYTSFTNPTYESLFKAARVHADTEAYLKASGLSFTILRDNQYISNIVGAVAQAKATGVLSLPGASGKVAYVTHDDVAASAVEVLLGAGHEGKIYEMTGSEAASLFDLAEALSTGWGVKIVAQEGDPAVFRQVFGSMGFPPFIVDLLMDMYAAVAAGELAPVSNDVERLTGRPATSPRAAVLQLA